MMKLLKKNAKEDRTSHEQQMRRRIKDAAFKLMAEQGIENVSMRQIAEKVHVTKPVLYYYFKDKEDLCTSIIDEHVKNFDMFLDSALSKKPNMASLLALVFERHLDFFFADPRNSKFIARTISYALSNKAKGFINDGRDQMGRMHVIFSEAAQKTGFPKDGSQFLEIDSEYFLGSDSPVLLTITAHVRNVWPYAYCEWDPDDWYRPVGYCRIQGYLFMFYDYQNTEVTRRLITPVPWKHRTLKLKSYLPSPYDPDFWCFFISDYSIIFLGSQAL